MLRKGGEGVGLVYKFWAQDRVGWVAPIRSARYPLMGCGYLWGERTRGTSSEVSPLPTPGCGGRGGDLGPVGAAHGALRLPSWDGSHGGVRHPQGECAPVDAPCCTVAVRLLTGSLLPHQPSVQNWARPPKTAGVGSRHRERASGLTGRPE